MRMRVAVLAALCCAALAGPAQAACPWPASYPGDAATKDQLAQWMAGGAAAAGLPAELPVMGALVESDLHNLDYGDRDAAGYFGMRKAVWDTGKYAGFVDHPELQLQWFVDQAQAARAKRIALGQQDPVLVETVWGDWIADVLLPAAQYRNRYQLRLLDARALSGRPAPSRACRLRQVGLRRRRRRSRPTPSGPCCRSPARAASAPCTGAPWWSRRGARPRPAPRRRPRRSPSRAPSGRCG